LSYYCKLKFLNKKLDMRKITTVLMAFLLSAVQLFAQNKTVTGKITDDKGAGLQGASVKAKGSTKGAITTADGSFSLTVPSTTKLLEISGIGFETQTVSIPSSGVVSVKMDVARAEDLGGVEVNTGITTYKRKHYAGAVGKITEKEISNQPVGSLDQILQGRSPGILALSGSGQPGTSANIIIRGSSSIQGGSSPLYIVDGIQVEEGVFQGINPNDFASMEILRDAAGTAMYGNRGSAGVIVITTKRGQAGKTRINYSAQFGTKDRPAFTYDMMNSRQLMTAQERYGLFLQNNGGVNIANPQGNMPGWFYSPLNADNAGLSPDELAVNRGIVDSMSRINTNWRDVFFRKGTFSNHQLDISGGIGKAAYRSTIGLYSEEGITLRTDMKRLTWRNNFDYKDDKFSIQLNTALGYTKRNFQQSTTTNSLGNPFLVSNISAPYTKVYNDDGSIAFGPTSEAQLNAANGLGFNYTEFSNKYAAANSLHLTSLDENYNDQLKVTANMIANYKAFKNVVLGLNAGFDFRETQGSNYGSRLAFTRRTSTSPTGQAGFQSETLGRYVAPNVKVSANWKNTYKDKHDFDVTLLGEYFKRNEKSISMTGYGIDPKTPNTPAAVTQGNGTNQLFANVGGGKTQAALLSGLLLGRYTYDDKYTLTASYRRDGASNLPTNTRWQNFFSVGATWDMKKESFLVKSKDINTLRLRASYGNAGNFNNFPFGDFFFFPGWSANGNYNGLGAYNPSSPGNPNLNWENHLYIKSWS
jgi:TonB-linked SusC/RagA family outer membrane protein